MRFAKNTQHGTSKVLRLPRKMTMDTSKVLPPATKTATQSSENVAKVLRLPRKNDFRHVPEHVWMSRSATPATRNEATRRLKPPKRTTSAKLPIGTAIRGSRERLRTVANGCGRLRTVATTNATSSEHTLNPQTPRVKREPLLRIREKTIMVEASWCAKISHTPGPPKSPSVPMATGAIQRCPAAMGLGESVHWCAAALRPPWTWLRGKGLENPVVFGVNYPFFVPYSFHIPHMKRIYDLWKYEYIPYGDVKSCSAIFGGQYILLDGSSQH